MDIALYVKSLIMSKKVEYRLRDLTSEEKEEMFLALSDDESIYDLAEKKSKIIELTSITEYEEEARGRYDTWGQIQGMSSGYDMIDDMTKGLVGGELIVIGARTSVGKTQLATNIAYRVARAGNPVLFVTLEMTKVELTSRIMKIAEPMPVTNLPIMYQNSSDLDWRDVDALMGNAVKSGVKLVVIDHLHYFSRSTENAAQEIGRVTKAFKKNAVDHNIPVILISHVRKMVGKQKKPTSEDLRDSSFVAQDADIVIMLHKEEDDLATVEAFLEKNRNRGIFPDTRYGIFHSVGAPLYERDKYGKDDIPEAWANTKLDIKPVREAQGSDSDGGGRDKDPTRDH